jgi:rubrerythrin
MAELSLDSIHALHMAMQNELDTVQIYEHILKHVRDSKAREMLHRLIVEEHNHEIAIKERIVSGGGKISNPEIPIDADYPNREQLFEIELENCTISELVNLAIENEQMSRDFYRLQHERAINNEVKEVFKWLVEQEEIHIRNLKSKYGALLV